MEADRRPFQAVSISLSSVETGWDRYARDDFSRPPHSNWRCNLTAMSQRHNLYFMASREDILVFEPDFPFQKLGKTPKLLVPPALAEPLAFGYLDSLGNSPGPHPHAINHLVVGDLGSEEILLVSTDSGNIAAYHTKAIFDAAQKDPFNFSPDGRADFVGLRPFLSHWVYESAWGLAIHREARMIAVSANTPSFIQTSDPSAKITVFAFALTSPTNPTGASGDEEPTVSGKDQAEWHDWVPATHSLTIPPRDRNYKIVLAGENGHATNIPSISFVNTREDSEGSWLLSCDIHGDLKCWQIWKATCFRTWNFAETPDPWRRRRQRQTDGGWMVAALDHVAFRPAHTLQTFVGHSKVPQYYGYMGMGHSYNTTNVVRLKTPGRSQRHPLNAEASDEEENEVPDPEEIGEPWSESDSDAEAEDQGPTVLRSEFSSQCQPAEGSQSVGPTQLQETSSMNVNSTSRQNESPSRPTHHPVRQVSGENNGSPGSIEDDDTAASTSELESMDTESEDVEDLEPLGRVMDEEIEGGSDDDSASYVDSIRSLTYLSDQTQRTSIEVETGPLPPTTSPEVSGDDGEWSRSNTAPATKRSLESQSGPVDSRPMQIPSIPTLHLSQSHLRLINLPRSRSPHFFCANILKQELPDLYNNMQNSNLQRLNMLQQIPELGIIVIGSQLGRVAVCSLTRAIPNCILGIRVDWILPTRRQERNGARPKNHELLGIAVAPIQGRQSASPDPYDDDGETWAKDCKVGGVDTTFDDQIVVLSNLDSHDHDSWSSEDDSQRQQDKQRASKKSRQKQSEPERRSSWATSTEYRHWPDKPKQGEDWEAIEGTRRYRLMMTYADMTVLTYEIGRGLERDEISVAKEGGGDVEL
ncbi:hypothetical protein DV736_g1725, partial [Chaetothyriales sp. CBS 134916]